MKRIKYLLMAMGVLGTLYVIGAEVWKTKIEESYVSFNARSSFGRVEGKIPGVQASIKFSEEDLKNSSVQASIRTASLDTDNKKRDNHLKSADFLDVEKYPEIKFSSKRFEKTEAGFSATGDLTIKDVTKEISFPFTFDNQGSKGTFRGSFSFNRRDYNVGKKTKMAGDKINIEIVTVVEK